MEHTLDQTFDQPHMRFETNGVIWLSNLGRGTVLKVLDPNSDMFYL